MLILQGDGFAGILFSPQNKETCLESVKKQYVSFAADCQADPREIN
jgi:hypothetical protein